MDNPQRQKKGPGLCVSAVPGQQLGAVDDFSAVSFCFSLPERAGASRGRQRRSRASALLSASGSRPLPGLWRLLTSSERPKRGTGWLGRALGDSAASSQVEEDLRGSVSAQIPEGHAGPRPEAKFRRGRAGPSSGVWSLVASADFSGVQGNDGELLWVPKKLAGVPQTSLVYPAATTRRIRSAPPPTGSLGSCPRRAAGG